MKCLKCGLEIADTSKFCGYCGNPVDKQIVQGQVEETSVESFNPVPPVQENNIESQEIQNAKQTKPKKVSSTWIFITCGVLLAVVAAVLTLIAFNKSSKNSITVLEKAINNLVLKGQNSGTITANVLVEGETDNLNISGVIKYEKQSDSYNLELTLNESMLFDQMNIFANIKNDSMNLYTKSSLIDMIFGTKSENDRWVNLNIPDLELKTDEIETEKVNLSGKGLEKKFKFVDKQKGLNHYALTIDRELINNIERRMTEEERQEYELLLSSIPESSTLIDKGYIVDFYINDHNELEKVSIDLSKYVDDDSITKVVLTVEFKDFNNTVASIPSEALNSSLDLETYMNENMDIEITPNEDVIIETEDVE